MRQEPVVLKGFVIEPMSKQNILALYDDLKDSKWWVDQTEHTFLSVFFGEPTPLGVSVQGRYFGVSAWRPSLRQRFKLNCVYEMLYRFSTPMNGQQKNLLVALVTMAQTRVLDYEPYPGYLEGREPERRVMPEEAPGRVLEDQREQEHQESIASQELGNQEGGPELLKQLATTTGPASYFLTPEGLRQGLAIVHSARCVGSCVCEAQYVVPGANPPIAWKAGPGSNKQRALEFVRYVNVTYRVTQGKLLQNTTIDVPQKKPLARKGKEELKKRKEHEPQVLRPYVDVIGSRMGLDSGLWHESFSSFVASFHPTVDIRYFDIHEEPRTYEIGQTKVEHVRGWYTGPKHTIVQIDDAQTGDEHIAPVWPRAYYFSEKKRGQDSFGIREMRYFSHLVPNRIQESMVSCSCWRCRMTSFVAQIYGGWPVYERVREYLAKLGSVCDHSNMLGMTTQIFEVTQAHMRTGEPIPQELAAFVPLAGDSGPLQQFIRSRHGTVYAYLAEFKTKIFLRAHPPDFVVLDSLLPLQEVGTPEYLISQATIDFPGYKPVRNLEGYTLWQLNRDKATPSFELKW